MKNIIIISSLVAVLTASASFAQASSTPATETQLSQSLIQNGEIPVANAGDYVQVGSYRIWVWSHLGRPTKTLPDGTWLYQHRKIDDTAVEGTLAVSFSNGRVSNLRLLSPAMATALLRPAHSPAQAIAAR